MTMTVNIKNTSLFQQNAYIDGQWVSADGGLTYQVDNPATQETIANMAECGADETNRAIEAAQTALASWRALTAKERAAYLKRWCSLILENHQDLAKILTAEQGKPLAEARGEIQYGANYLEWFAEEAKRVYGDVIPGPSNDKRVIIIKQPVGVVACITPWNFPMAMLARKIAPALAAGCTVVCKPANLTPLSAFALAELADQAGIPKGVINVISGRTHEIGDALTAHPDVRKLTFTGSTAVGKSLTRACADTLKRTSMELGGNAPFIVFDDADLDAAVAGAIVSKYRNAGQTCVCSNRIFVQRGVYETFVDKLIAATADLKLGDGMADDVTIGPMISEKARQDVQAMIDDDVKAGATLAHGGQTSDLGPCFLEPAVLTGVTDKMRVFREEIFGPVAPLIVFDDEDEVIRMANDTEYGLAAYFYTRDIGRVWRVSEGLEYGMVALNDGIVSNEMAPFGGVKESGQGREGSKYGLDDYLEIKYLSMGGLDR